jgi:hypothetical protein
MTHVPNGIYISDATAEGTRQIHIDHETIEFAALNCRTRRRPQQATAKQAAANREAAKRQYRTNRMIKRNLSLTAACVLPWVATAAGLASPILAAIVSIPCFGSLCFRAGRNK